MTTAIIQLEDIHFAYPQHDPILRGVNLELHPNRKLGLVGGNGCGKTTLLSSIVGLTKPTQGTILAFGQPRTTEKSFTEVRRRTGFVFQNADDQLFCPTVIEDVAFGLLNLGKAPSQALELALETLELLGLDGLAQRITYKLSGGEKKLVSLATVLAMQPEVLLLDEPTTGLDEPAQKKLTAILSDLPQAMLIVSHEQNFLADITDQTLQLKNGKVY